MSLESFYENAKRLANQAAKKINRGADLATLKLKLTVAEDKLEEAYAALGKATYLHFSEENNRTEAIAKAMERVKAEQDAVALLKAEIEAAKSAAKEKASSSQGGENTSFSQDKAEQ